MVSLNRKYFLGSITIALLLCATQISGSTITILMCLAAFVGLLCFGCSRNFTLPLLLFFLPWSPLLRPSPENFSFYTVVLVLVCMISAVKNWFCFKRYHITTGILLLLLTLFSKLLDGSRLAMNYICFMMLIVLFPVVREEMNQKKYDFYGTVAFFSAGVVIAALCAQQFASYHNIARYINVHSYLTIIRRCGFYGDPNFYTAQITAALGGCLVMILKERARGRTIFLGILLVLLLYCGFLSGSKSFVLVTAGMLLIWIVELLRMRGRSGLKLALLLCGVAFAIYIATSSLFSGLIDVLITRFSTASDMDSFTTGRTELWKSYFDVLMEDIKVLILGKGFTDIKVNMRASHNTIIQIIYQFGLVGSPILLGWIACFFRGVHKEGHSKRESTIRSLILLVGAFFPWMAIDALFFDEFFLLQWYCFMGMREISSMESTAESFEDGSHTETEKEYDQN